MSKRIRSPYAPYSMKPDEIMTPAVRPAVPETVHTERVERAATPSSQERKPMAKHQPDHIVAKNDGGASFTPHPAGQFASRCVDVIDLGEKVEQYEGKPPKLAHKVALVFRTGETNPDTGEIIDIAKEFTVSMYETANLRKFLAAWRGKDFTDDEVEEGAPLHKLCGVSALLNVEHKKSGNNRVYANVNAIQKLPKVMEPGCPIGDDYERPEYLTKRKATYAEEALAYKKRINAPMPKGNAAGYEEFPPAVEDEDSLPF
jgi:hypothetical protein